jgi:uncharacterized membrane protein YdjX (TVP38/TMEM64 family)
VLVIRLSAVPSHFSTAVFSTCDVKFWHFCAATFLSLPKQLVLVYLGVLLVQSDDASKDGNKSKDNIIKSVMFGLAGVVTVLLGIWIYIKMVKVKKVLVEEQEQRNVKRAEGVQLVPSVKSAFPERRYDEEPSDWAMHPTQPLRMV